MNTTGCDISDDNVEAILWYRGSKRGRHGQALSWKRVARINWEILSRPRRDHDGYNISRSVTFLSHYPAYGLPGVGSLGLGLGRLETARWVVSSLG